MQINQKKKLVAGLSITSNVFLSLLKIIVGVLSGSISIKSEKYIQNVLSQFTLNLYATKNPAKNIVQKFNAI